MSNFSHTTIKYFRSYLFFYLGFSVNQHYFTHFELIQSSTWGKSRSCPMKTTCYPQAELWSNWGLKKQCFYQVHCNYQICFKHNQRHEQVSTVFSKGLIVQKGCNARKYWQRTKKLKIGWMDNFVTLKKYFPTVFQSYWDMMTGRFRRLVYAMISTTSFNRLDFVPVDDIQIVLLVSQNSRTVTKNVLFDEIYWPIKRQLNRKLFLLLTQDVVTSSKKSDQIWVQKVHLPSNVPNLISYPGNIHNMRM